AGQGTRPAHDAECDERGAHPSIGVVRTLAVLPSRGSYTPVYRGIGLWMTYVRATSLWVIAFQWGAKAASGASRRSPALPFDLSGNANFSTTPSVSIKRVNFDNSSLLNHSFSPAGKTNTPSGRLIPQIVQSKSLFLLSAVIGIGNLITIPFDDAVL